MLPSQADQILLPGEDPLRLLRAAYRVEMQGEGILPEIPGVLRGLRELP